MKFLLTSILSSVFLFATAQTYTWQRMYGTADRETAAAVVQLPDGDYVFVGTTYSPTTDSAQILLCKTDRVGNAIWQHQLATTGNSSGYDLQVVPNGGLVIAGTIADSTNFTNMYVAQVTSTGDLLWEKTYGGDLNDAATSIKPTADGGFILTGYTETAAEGEELALIKLDQNGALQWQVAYGGAQNERGAEVIVTNDGGYAVTGFTESFGAGQRDLFLIKTDFVGNEQWLKTYGNPNNQMGYGLEQNAEGGFVVAGSSEFSSYYPADLYLMGTDAEGKEIWSNSYGGDARIEGFSIDKVGDEGYIVAGSRSTFFGFYPAEFYLFRIDLQGVRLWDRAFVNEFPATAQSVVSTQDGGYLVAGYAQPTTDTITRDAQLVKTDALGRIDTTFRVVIENNSPLACFGDTDGQIDVYVTGGTYPYTYNWEQLTAAEFKATDLAAATYTVTVTDANGQQTSRQTAVTTPAELTLAAATTTNTSCPESADGTAVLTPTGGTAPYGYLWNNGITTADAATLTAGDYRVTVVDANACQAVTEFSIGSASAIAVEIAEQTAASCGDTNDGSLRINVTGGDAPFTYQLNNEMFTESTFTDLAAGDYTLLVRDANGCRVTQEFTISELAESSPTANFTNQITELSVAFNANLTAADSVRWDFGNGNFSTETNPIYAYPTGGDYTVCLTATNACGSTTVCNVISLLDCSDAVITTDFATNSSDTTVQFTNTSVGDTESFRWRFGDGNSSRSENPVHTYANPGSYEVCLTARNVCGSYTFCDSVRVELSTIIAIDVAGEVQMIDGQAMEKVVLSCGALIDTTGVDGRYELQTNARANCAVTPFKEDAALNGVTTFDIIMIRRHVLRIRPFTSPYQMIAADVNNSGTITSFDMIIMQRLVLGLVDEFAAVPTWRFVPQDYEFAPGEFAGFPESVPLNNFTASRSDVNFIGIKMGDVNNSAVPNFQSELTARSARSASLLIENQFVAANEVINVPLRLPTAASGFQLALQFAAAEILEVEAVGLVGFDQHNFNINSQQLTLSWSAAADIAHPETAILNLKLRTNRAGLLNEIIQINPTRTSPELYTPALDALTLDLQFTEPSEEFSICISPNPARAIAHINWNKPLEANAVIQLINAQGQLVQRWKVGESATNQSLPLVGLARGVYFLVFSNGAQRKVEKLVIE